MSEAKYIRKVQTSVTNFLFCGDEYLFIHKGAHKWIDANKLNGIGGRLEPKENYLECAIRETEEETGYKVSAKNISLCGVVKLEGGYSEDWVMCFFKIEVPSKEIPLGHETEDGKLVWIHKDQVLKSDYELVDDLNYCFNDIVKGKEIFFINAQLNHNEKIDKITISKLAK